MRKALTIWMLIIYLFAAPAVGYGETSQKELIRQSKRIYSEAWSACKAKRYTFAQEKMDALRDVLVNQDFPEGYRKKMTKKLDVVQQRIDKGRDIDKYRQEAKKKKEDARINRIKQKEELRRKKRLAKQAKREMDREVKERRRREKMEDKQDRTDERKRIAFEKKLARYMDGEEKKKKGMKSNIKKEQQKINAKRKDMLSWAQGLSDEKKKKANIAIMKQKQDISGEQDHIRSELLQGVNSLYGDALVLYRAGEYEDARDILLEVDKLWPDYKLTKNYLDIIEQNVREDDNINDYSDERDVIEGELYRIVNDALDAVEFGGK